MSLPLWEAEKILTAADVFNNARVEEAKAIVAEAENSKKAAGVSPEGDNDPEMELPEIP